MEGFSYNKRSVLEKYDSAPTANSTNLVPSGGIKTYVDTADATIDAKVDQMIARVGNPFVFKGTVADIANLPANNNTVNDTYFVTDPGFMYTWNGSSWDKTSTDVNNQLAHDIATDYDETKADYKAGNLVMYNNQVYVRNADATAAEGTFVAANWTATSIGDELYDEVTNLKSALTDFNAYDYLLDYRPTSKTSGGVTWVSNGDHSVTVSSNGPASSTSLNNIYFETSMLPDWVVPGNSYKVKYRSDKVYFRLLVYKDGDTSSPVNILNTTIDAEVTIPSDTTGIIVRYAVSSGTTVAPETVRAIIMNTSTNEELENTIEVNQKLYISRDYLENSTIHRTNLAYSGSFLYPGYTVVNSGVTFEVNPDYSIHVYGTATATSIMRFHIQFNISEIYTYMPQWFKSGKILKLDYYSDNVEFRLNVYDRVSGTASYELFNNYSMGMCKIPAIDYDSYFISPRLAVRSGVTVDEVVYPILTEFTSNQVEDRLLTELGFTRISPLVPFLSKAFYGSFSINLTEKNFTPTYSRANPIRISIDITGICKCNIRMLDPKYVFRFYWFESSDDVVHSTSWGSSWNVPQSYTQCMLTIKNRENGDLPLTLKDTPLINLVAESTEIKSYFKDEITNVTNRVNIANTEPGLMFLLSTDQHYNSVQGTQIQHDTITDMVLNQKELLKNIVVDGVISLGDVADFKVGTESKFGEYGVTDLTYPNLDLVFYNWMKYAVNKLSSVHPNFMYVPGNHDDNRYINKDNLQESTSTYDYTPGEIYSYYVSKNRNFTVHNSANNGLDYYIDYPMYKLRLFFIDANHYYNEGNVSPHGYTDCWWYGWQDSTVTWFHDCLNSTPDDYAVVLFSHMSVVKQNNADNVNYVNQVNMYNELQDFIQNGGTFVGEFYGHSHADWSTTNPWLSVAFDCQKCYAYTPDYSNMPGAIHNERVAGTATEDCWNILIIQPEKRRIKVIRFGAGEDRDFTY